MSEGEKISQEAIMLWNNILGELKEVLPTTSYEMAVKPLGVKSYENNTLTLIANNNFWSKFVKEKLNNDLIRVLKKYSQNPDTTYEIIVDKNFKSQSIVEPQKPKENKVTTTQTQLSFEVNFDALKQMSAYNLNVKYSFDNFVVADSNKFAFKASKAVAEDLGRLYNPLFIWGGAGLGKTHLMNAIGCYILRKYQDLKLKYITTNEFTNEFTNIMCMFKGNPHKKNEFINKYRNIDVLLIDDVQFLEAREGTQNEIFTIFDYLHRNGKQIIITSDRPPKDIPTLTDRLRSRFEWGLLAEIKPPDFETRKEILRLKSKEHEVTVPEDVIELLAGVFVNNVRELEGALNKVTGYMSIEEKPIDLETAKELINYKAINKKLTTNTIMEYVASYFNVETSEFKCDSRSKEIVYARDIAIYLSREFTKASFPQLGNDFGNRKSSTVLYSYEKIKKNVEYNADLKQDIKNITSQIAAEYMI